MSDNKRLDDLLRELKKKHGENAVQFASDLPPLRALPTGIANLDDHLGGGVLWGRITSLAGNRSSGKTATAMKLAANMQALGGVVFWYDLERQFDKERALIFGLNPEEIIVRRDDEEWVAESFLEILKIDIRAVREAKIKALFVVDSLTALSTEKVMEDAASSMYDTGAKMNNQTIKIINALLPRKAIFLIINQLRDNVGSMGDPNIMPGGQGQNFFASAIVWLREGQPIKDGQETIGYNMDWTVKKSRSSPPKSRGGVPFYYATGPDYISALVETAVANEILEKTGGWYKLPEGIVSPTGAEKVNGMAALVEALRENQEFLNKLKSVVYSKMPVKFWNGEDE